MRGIVFGKNSSFEPSCEVQVSLHAADAYSESGRLGTAVFHDPSDNTRSAGCTGEEELHHSRYNPNDVRLMNRRTWSNDTSDASAERSLRV